jgi:hypothetical protein
LTPDCSLTAAPRRTKGWREARTADPRHPPAPPSPAAETTKKSTALVCFPTVPRRTEKQSRSVGARAATPPRLTVRPWATEATFRSIGSCGPHNHAVANHSPLARQGYRVPLPLPLLSLPVLPKLRRVDLDTVLTSAPGRTGDSRQNENPQSCKAHRSIASPQPPCAAEAAQSRPGYRPDLCPRTNRQQSPKREPAELQRALLNRSSSANSLLPKLRRVDPDTVLTSTPGRTGDGHQDEHPRSRREHDSIAPPWPSPCCRSCAELAWVLLGPPPPDEPATVIKTSTRGVAKSIAPSPLLSLIRVAEAARSWPGYRVDLRLRTNRRRPSKRAPSELQGASLTS